MEVASTSSGYTRGVIGNPCLAQLLAQRELEAGDIGPEEELLGAYLDHHVGKRIRQYLFAGVNSIEALAGLIDSVARLSFSVLLSQMPSEMEDVEEIITQTKLRSDYSLGGTETALGIAVLGSAFALGHQSAVAGTVIHIEMGLSGSQMERLYSSPWTLPHLMRSMDSAIPIDCDYILHFGLRDARALFCLPSDADRGAPPRLGLTTLLADD